MQVHPARIAKPVRWYRVKEASDWYAGDPQFARSRAQPQITASGKLVRAVEAGRVSSARSKPESVLTGRFVLLPAPTGARRAFDPGASQ